ncbi:MAG: DNA cytosine methyltransferase [Moorellales bacterium]
MGSLFSGVGGLDLGLERAGMEIVWQVENDPFRQAVLAKHWPEVKRYGDIRTIDPAELEPVELVAGGPPCQPVSVAGKQRGAQDERWLWPEMARIIAVLHPQWIIMENVTGLLKWGFGIVLRDLAAFGYDAEWAVLSAEEFGYPHRRERIFIVAYPKGFGCQSDEFKPIIFNENLYRTTQDKANEWQVARGCSGRILRVPNSRICRVANGVPDRMDRYGSLGDAVIPEIAEAIGKTIILYSCPDKRCKNGV